MLGALTVVSVDRGLKQEDVAFAERLAGHVAAVVDNARRYESTLETSQVLQQSLLPQALPEIAGLEVAYRYLPATRGLEVGGDFYDLVALSDRRVSFLIGDVAGHDRQAAAVMGQLRSATRVLVGQVSDPAELIGALQQSWGLLGFDRIATALSLLNWTWKAVGWSWLQLGTNNLSWWSRARRATSRSNRVRRSGYLSGRPSTGRAHWVATRCFSSTQTVRSKNAT